jgi:hypothetical protein
VTGAGSGKREAGTTGASGPATGGESASRVSATRVILLAIVTAAIALAFQLTLIALGLGRDNPIRLLLVPITGALLVYYGLSGYSKWGRIRLSVMVGAFLLLFASAA